MKLPFLGQVAAELVFDRLFDLTSEWRQKQRKVDHDGNLTSCTFGAHLYVSFELAAFDLPLQGFGVKLAGQLGIHFG